MCAYCPPMLALPSRPCFLCARHFPVFAPAWRNRSFVSTRRRPTVLASASQTSHSPTSLSSAAASLAALPDVAARVRALVSQGDSAEKLPLSECSKTTRVTGCISVTHLKVGVEWEKNESGSVGRVRVKGWSDARVAMGLIALVVKGFDGVDVEAVLAENVDEVVDKTGLGIWGKRNRAGGLRGIALAVQQRVAVLVKNRELGGAGIVDEPKESTSARWTGVQQEEAAVLLSGGVDSSVALRLVQEAGYRPRAFYLKIWLEDELAHLGECPWEEDVGYAAAVCEQAGVELETLSMQKEYWERVVEYTIAEVRNGRTPNPDIMCNSRVKFGAFYDVVGKFFPRVVTGHYARKRTSPDTGLAELCLTPDHVKDQTYFLAHLNQEQLSRAEFPLGSFEKQRVREIAADLQLPNMNRKDSQGICFLGKLKFDDFLFHHLGDNKGPLVEFETGQLVGEHRGFWYYTVGQRRGIGLAGGPWYVVSKDPGANVVYISRVYDGATSALDAFEFESASWLSGSWPLGCEASSSGVPLRVKVRHGPTLYPCELKQVDGARGHVRLTSGTTPLAPGQFAVFYSGDDVCLGSGVISESVLRRERPAIVSASSASQKLVVDGPAHH